MHGRPVNNYEIDIPDYCDPFAEEPAPVKKKPKPRPKRCGRCRGNIEPDGYGCWVHSGTEEYPAVFYGCPVTDDHGNPVFIKPTDPRFADVATL